MYTQVYFNISDIFYIEAAPKQSVSTVRRYIFLNSKDKTCVLVHMVSVHMRAIAQP